MNLRIFADLDKSRLNEPQRKIITNIEKLLYSIESELYLHTGFCINEINDEFVDGRLGSPKGLIELKLYIDGKFEFKIPGTIIYNKDNNIDNLESIEYFKSYLKR